MISSSATFVRNQLHKLGYFLIRNNDKATFRIENEWGIVLIDIYDEESFDDDISDGLQSLVAMLDDKLFSLKHKAAI